MNVTTKRTRPEVQWLKRAWFLANCQFKLSKSPGFEAHRVELEAFEQAWGEYYRAWERDNIWDLFEVTSVPGMEDIELYEAEIAKLQKAKERIWANKYLKEKIHQANELGLSPNQADRYLALEEEVAELRNGLKEAFEPPY